MIQFLNAFLIIISIYPIIPYLISALLGIVIYSVGHSLLNVTTAVFQMFFQGIDYALSKFEQHSYRFESYLESSKWQGSRWYKRIFANGSYFIINIINTLLIANIASFFAQINTSFKNLRIAINPPSIFTLMYNAANGLYRLKLKAIEMISSRSNLDSTKVHSEVKDKTLHKMLITATKYEDNTETKHWYIIAFNHFLKGEILQFNKILKDQLETFKNKLMPNSEKPTLFDIVFGYSAYYVASYIYEFIRLSLLFTYYDYNIFNILSDFLNTHIPKRDERNKTPLYNKNVYKITKQAKKNSQYMLGKAVDTFVKSLSYVIKPLRDRNENIGYYFYSKAKELKPNFSELLTNLNVDTIKNLFVFLCYVVLSILNLIIAVIIGFNPEKSIDEIPPYSHSETVTFFRTCLNYEIDIVCDTGMVISLFYLFKPALSLIVDLLVETINLGVSIILNPFQILYSRWIQKEDSYLESINMSTKPTPGAAGQTKPFNNLETQSPYTEVINEDLNIIGYGNSEGRQANI
ncbi:MAG: hypothetical protein P8L77_00940 [Gammaproteobacteria bacterium]|nr:hypothetical protein [Gammaproteobacteria bacterium]